MPVITFSEMVLKQLLVLFCCLFHFVSKKYADPNILKGDYLAEKLACFDHSKNLGLT